MTTTTTTMLCLMPAERMTLSTSKPINANSGKTSTKISVWEEEEEEEEEEVMKIGNTSEARFYTEHKQKKPRMRQLSALVLTPTQSNMPRQCSSSIISYVVGVGVGVVDDDDVDVAVHVSVEWQRSVESKAIAKDIIDDSSPASPETITLIYVLVQLKIPDRLYQFEKCAVRARTWTGGMRMKSTQIWRRICDYAEFTTLPSVIKHLRQATQRKLAVDKLQL
ncbi:unnamed protein product [Ceratitis capitata]|uniref:(Mediterranean fruit fly) hypothetical protein n=1 Tax=Ceratitis capitata TaxID=7213 RepID=A0A811UYI0_CERCA|nr:unnamed protein product [Ceratitis capitata]